MSTTTIIREFLLKVQLDVAVESDSDYEKLADELDHADLMSMIANNVVIDTDAFAEKVLGKVEGPTVTVSIGDPVVHNVHDFTGEDISPYIDVCYDCPPHDLKSEERG